MRGVSKLQVWAVLLSSLSLAMAVVPTNNDHVQELLKVQPRVSTISQKDSVLGLIKRLLPQHAHLFQVVVDGTLAKNSLDYFKLESVSNQTIRVSANTGIAAANGIYYYLKNIANCSVSWSGDQLTLPKGKIPLPHKPIEMTIPEKFRYYQNVCTVSYSMVWWDWARWEREIDWMALHGINLPLAFNGQEMVFRHTLQRFNLTIAQIDNYFTGPAFLAWNRMGNMQTWSGPLTEHWHQHQMMLQKKILERMRSFGMFPVVPGFAGHVPRHLAQILRNAKINQLTDWNYFGKNYSFTSFLQPEDPYFVQIGKTYIEEYIKLYGTDHFYNIDLFNEETPTSGDPSYLKKCGKGVYDSIIQADPKGIWVMQGWLFVNQPNFWGTKQVEAMVTSVPQGKLLILDLFSEVAPAYSRFNGYYGQPFIWCMLHNFGGTLGMYGAFNLINEKVFDARKKYSNMLGIGLTPEGIEQNPVMYEYMTEVIWYATAPDMDHWVETYATQRYGIQDSRVSKAWHLLRASVFTDPHGLHNHGRYAINVLPRLNFKSVMWYNPRNVTEAFKLLAQFAHSNNEMLRSETFVYDLVDVTRQTLQLLFDYFYAHLNIAYTKRNGTDLNATIASLEHVLDLSESALQASKHFLLYNWIDSARRLGNDTKEQDYNEWQARNQVSIWGPKANINDYAAKQWSGMMKYFYKPRWQLFFTWLQMDLLEETKFDQKKFASNCFDLVEIPFTYAKHQLLVKAPETSQLLGVVHEVENLVTKTIDLEQDTLTNYSTISSDA